MTLDQTLAAIADNLDRIAELTPARAEADRLDGGPATLDESLAAIAGDLDRLAELRQR